MSMDSAIHALKAQLGQMPPAGLDVLSDEHLHSLAAAIAGARHRQAAELEAAGDRALGRIPRVLRGPVRKVVGM